MSELHELSKFCDYEEALDNILCDCLVCGLAERRVQQHLLAEGDLDFGQSYEDSSGYGNGGTRHQGLAASNDTEH